MSAFGTFPLRAPKGLLTRGRCPTPVKAEAATRISSQALTGFIAQIRFGSFRYFHVEMERGQGQRSRAFL